MGNQLGGVFRYNLEVNSSYERRKEWRWKGKEEGERQRREGGRERETYIGQSWWLSLYSLSY